MTSPRSERRAARAARRADADGSGPTLGDTPRLRNPGAAGAFALFGEVLLVGLLVSLVSLPVLTLPAALAAGVRHLRRYIAADDSRVRFFWQDVRAALLPGLVVGLAAAVATVVLLIDIDLARSGFLPGGPVVGAIGWVGLAAVAVSLLFAASLWSPDLGWRGAIRAIPEAVRGDIAGAFYLLAAAGFVVVVTWMLPPLFVAGIGCAVLAVVSIPSRPRRR
ncbi:DUF624 domain-containing protein [Microbacterium radiodurans]|uniref:DUF624 domain-containing protein n=1 Tax=Microbacterium radiodurans TaxID=661398 RepID=A0A5J5IVB9_9MICO|nr:DUF624 domain-containing protein [Microbacterium radiodurans]KAA9089639.1 DUF624 domain-containing protein [Microbacterium radiodurans]